MSDFIADQIKAYKDWISEERRIDKETLSLSQYSKPEDPTVSKLITEGHSHVFRLLESMRIEIAQRAELSERDAAILGKAVEKLTVATNNIHQLRNELDELKERCRLDVMTLDEVREQISLLHGKEA